MSEREYLLNVTSSDLGTSRFCFSFAELKRLWKKNRTGKIQIIILFLVIFLAVFGLLFALVASIIKHKPGTHENPNVIVNPLGLVKLPSNFAIDFFYRFMDFAEAPQQILIIVRGVLLVVGKDGRIFALIDDEVDFKPNRRLEIARNLITPFIAMNGPDLYILQPHSLHVIQDIRLKIIEDEDYPQMNLVANFTFYNETEISRITWENQPKIQFVPNGTLFLSLSIYWDETYSNWTSNLNPQNPYQATIVTLDPPYTQVQNIFSFYQCVSFKTCFFKIYLQRFL